MSVNIEVSLEQLRQRQCMKWTYYGPEVLPAWIADMDYPVAPVIRQAIAATVERNDLGYTGEATEQALGKVFAERMERRYGWQPDPSLVRPTGNLIQALIASVASFSDPGSGIVIQTPIYYPFLKIVAALGRQLVDNRLLVGPQRYEMDIPGLQAAIDDDTRMVLFCNPHNPSGRVFERGALEQLAALAVERDLIVVSDEIHADLAYPGQQHIPLASLGPEIAARTITLTSATKAFSIAGLKCAVMHFGSQELLRKQTGFFNEHLLGTSNVLGIEATLAAWRDGDEWLETVITQLASNRRRLGEFIEQRLGPGKYRPPEAGYLAWLDCGALNLTPSPHEFFLQQAGVALSDGGVFSSYTPEFARLNFATSPEVLELILQRIAEALDNRQGRQSSP